MDKLLTKRDIMARYGVSATTAERYMRKMIHMEKPLRVTERALLAWEAERTANPADAAALKKARRRAAKREEWMPIPEDGVWHIPRRRE